MTDWALNRPRAAVRSGASRWARIGVALLAAALLLSGCMFRELKKDVARFDQMALLGGHATRTAADDAPLVIVLVGGKDNSVFDSFVLERPGAYFFLAPPGTYRVAAFADLNRDFTYQPETEPAALLETALAVKLAPGDKVNGVDLAVPLTPGEPLGFAVTEVHLGKRGSKELPDVRMGEVVTFDDPRFKSENGELGLWQPVEFLFRVGSGFYFLEPFDPKKTPVLFVHGAGGTPEDFRSLVGRLDRSKFQPWLLYYPTGLDLEVAARGAARWLTALATQYDFQHIAIVAHSMGGLVSRAMINNLMASGHGDLVAGLVTISSPWGGYAAAKAGAEHSPVVMPMWRDMAPGSPFLQGLFRSPLPPTCPAYLLFSYGGRSGLLSEANDGVVPVWSELRFEAQQSAHKVYGFNETHMSILANSDVSGLVNGFLAEAVQ